MRSLSDTLARLSAYRSRSLADADTPNRPRLIPFTTFGSNPGALGAMVYTPRNLEPGAPLVVVLHGCTQSAAAYDAGSGWSTLADRHGFALLYPEQQRSNNPALCFNWFAPDDIRHGAGEAASIMQMITAFTAAHGLNPSRILITGLSAGGAMAATMLALYPDVFAGGAIIAGLPFGSARTVPEAFDRMRGHGGSTRANLSTSIRASSPHLGDWPAVSIWHGNADQTVCPSNGEDLAAQWRGVHNLGEAPSDETSTEAYTLRIWRDASGQPLVRHYAVRGMGHGVPIRAASGVGAVGPFMIDAGVSATELIAQSWGLISDAAQEAVSDLVEVPTTEGIRVAESPARQTLNAPRLTSVARGNQQTKPSRVQQVIEDALRKAGLM